MKSISLVVVSWNSGADLPACVESLAAARRQLEDRARDLELIVIDNASDELSERELKEAWPDLRLVRLGENIGFGPAANRGAGKATGEILLFLNPDTRAVAEPFSALSRAFEDDPDIVAAAPRLLEEAGAGRGEAQNEFQLRRLPSLASHLREQLLIDRIAPANRWRRRERYLDLGRDKSFEVEQPAGAALAVRRDVFNRVGGFDPRFVPAWWEDVDLCRRLGAAGRIVFLPQPHFTHRGGASADRLGYDHFVPIYYRNELRYWRKHFGHVSTAAFRLLLAGGMVLRILLLPWRRRDPRPKRHSLRAYAGAFRVAWNGQ